MQEQRHWLLLKKKQKSKRTFGKGGEWNVESLYAKQVITNSADNFEETIYNYGTILHLKKTDAKMIP